MGVQASVYALYKGDKFLDLGTKKELSERTGIKLKTLDFLASNINKQRINKRKYQNALMLIKIGKEGDDLE
jgi:hypothetical protein